MAAMCTYHAHVVVPKGDIIYPFPKCILPSNLPTHPTFSKPLFITKPRSYKSFTSYDLAPHICLQLYIAQNMCHIVQFWVSNMLSLYRAFSQNGACVCWGYCLSKCKLTYQWASSSAFLCVMIFWCRMVRQLLWLQVWKATSRLSQCYWKLKPSLTCRQRFSYLSHLSEVHVAQMNDTLIVHVHLNGTLANFWLNCKCH